MPDLALAAIAAHRFGFGPRPGELSAIAGDPRGWVKAQLRAPASEPPAIAALPAAEDDLLAFRRWLARQRLSARGETEMAGAGEQASASQEGRQAASLEQSYVGAFRDRFVRAVNARIIAAATSDAPVLERLVHFWGNHFTVSSLKPAASVLPPSFERDVARAHAQGRFSTMLIASCRHPGMLIYLDNVLSVGPNSSAGLTGRGAPRAPGGAGGQVRDINENLAREVLELHTMGVEAGYTQADVQALAAILSGWTVDRPRRRDILSDQAGERSGDELFRFDEALHEPGPQRLLGELYPDHGLAQGEAALLALSRRPETARFLAFKLARHFVSDAPPAAVIARMAQAYLDSDGDLTSTVEAMVDSPEAWEAPLVKFRRPEDYLIALLRSLNIQALPESTAWATTALASMGQRPFSAPGPDGWDDTEAGWIGADQVWKRVEFASEMAERFAGADLRASALAEAWLGPLLSAATRRALQQAESPAQALTLLFAAPEMQRR
ncbi:MAG: DUF1800 family protein [Alphaproteobacteria bacterium]|nr:DUF1800 family protein [Alphaproteobacteria bacterium]